MNDQMQPWIEKYRPKTMADVISHNDTITTLENFISNNKFPHLLFYGPPGTGKTSVITTCTRKLYKPEEIDYMVLEINASGDRGIDVVRNRINPFVMASRAFISGSAQFKLIILDEVDAMTTDAQAALRQIIENYSENTRFCLICNYIKKINLALQSRCTRFRFPPLDSAELALKIREILAAETMTMTMAAIELLIRRSGGDMRKILNTLQSLSTHKVCITETIINMTMGMPDKHHVSRIVNSLLFDDFAICVSTIDGIVYKNGYSLRDILAEIYELIMGSVLNGVTDYLQGFPVFAILKALGDIEFNMSICEEYSLQTGAIVGVFKTGWAKANVGICSKN